MTLRSEKKSKILMALCGGLMVGVSIPIILASIHEGLFVLLGGVMLIAGFSLIFTLSKPYYQAKVSLLLLHILIAAVVLVGILVSKPDAFLIGWSSSVIMLGLLSIWSLRKCQKI